MWRRREEEEEEEEEGGRIDMVEVVVLRHRK